VDLFGCVDLIEKPTGLNQHVSQTAPEKKSLLSILDSSEDEEEFFRGFLLVERPLFSKTPLTLSGKLAFLKEPGLWQGRAPKLAFPSLAGRWSGWKIEVKRAPESPGEG
jgi:hypothetical protein